MVREQRFHQSMRPPQSERVAILLPSPSFVWAELMDSGVQVTNLVVNMATWAILIASILCHDVFLGNG
jgi:hypothetical protein